jgi:predicted nucleic acid-binding protein
VNLYFDTSVLVAASIDDHPHHPQAFAALKQVMVAGSRHRAYVSAHGLAEVYSVLTRAPLIPPVHPTEGWQMIERNILPHFKVVVLSAKEYQDIIRDCATHGWAGGRIYDAIHIWCAQKEDCDRIYTFNVRDFRELASPNSQGKVCAP